MTDRALPPARRAGSYRIALVCLGNICRSPMAAVVLEARLAGAGLADHVAVVSSGTAGWHVGRPMDPRAAAMLTSHGYDATRHRARQWDRSVPDDEQPDLVLAMDAENLRDLLDLLDHPDRDLPDPGGRIVLFRTFDPEVGLEVGTQAGAGVGRGVGPWVGPGGTPDVPDPYYGGVSGFEEVLVMVERTAAVLVELLRREQPWSRSGPA